MNKGTRNDSGTRSYSPVYWLCFALLFISGNVACGTHDSSNNDCTATSGIELPANGVPFDWSHKHLIASGDGANGPLGLREHRLLYTYLRRKQSMCSGGAGSAQGAQQIDWDVPLGASMADGTYPAKYNFNMPGQTPTCSDFIVYGLNTAGATGGQPNLVGLTNLYSGTANGNGLCNGNAGVSQKLYGYGATVYAATVKFAYNGSTINGAITNSVVMSEDGTKIAYVESNGTNSVLHVVTTAPPPSGAGSVGWNGGGVVVASAVLPTSISTVPSTGSWAAADSFSSVWVDYSNDLAYVGTDDGTLHRIQNVFCTTSTCKGSPVRPSEVTTSPWPVTLAGAGALTSPVEDEKGVIYVAGAKSGLLYAVTSKGSVTKSNQTFMQNSIVDGAMLDVDGNGVTQAIYWFSNSRSAASNPTVQQPQMVQTNSALTSINNYSLLPNNTGSWGWNGATTATTVHAGTFDNAFYNNRNGNMWACGWWQDGPNGWSPNHQQIIRFGINNTTVTPDVTTQYPQTSPNNVVANLNTCAPLTEVLDSAGADHIFVSSRVGYEMPVGTCTTQASCIAGFTIGSSGSPATYSLTTTGSYALNNVDNGGAGYNNYTSGIVIDNAVSPTSNTCGPSGNQSCAQAASIYFTYGNDAIKLTQAQLQ